MDRRHSCAKCSSTEHLVSACPTYKEGIDFSLDDEDASEINHEGFEGGVFAKFCTRFFLATWMVILNQVVHNFWILLLTLSTQGMKKHA